MSIFIGDLHEHSFRKKLFNWILRKYEHRFAYAIYNDKNILHAVNHPSIRFGKDDYSWHRNGTHHRYYGPAINWTVNASSLSYHTETIRWIIHGKIIV